MSEAEITGLDDDGAVQPKSKTLIIGEWILNILLIGGLIFLFLFIVHQIIQLWPGSNSKDCILMIALKTNSDEQRYFLLVALGGALGAFVHTATSFADFFGNKKLVYSWVPWYILRPFIGSALAIAFYVLVRGGLLSVTENAGEEIPLNPHGILAVSILAGLFSKQAIDKLREVFETLFQLKKEVKRDDSLENNNGQTDEIPESDETPKG
ncbi:MAG: hypothetical protein HC819_19300 [Cyclobacteriaceae bacterium]|nr:hypothetical protein [Cyclobacteriaceae bacterium]